MISSKNYESSTPNIDSRCTWAQKSMSTINSSSDRGEPKGKKLTKTKNKSSKRSVRKCYLFKSVKDDDSDENAWETTSESSKSLQKAEETADEIFDRHLTETEYSWGNHADIEVIRDARPSPKNLEVDLDEPLFPRPNHFRNSKLSRVSNVVHNKEQLFIDNDEVSLLDQNIYSPQEKRLSDRQLTESRKQNSVKRPSRMCTVKTGELRDNYESKLPNVKLRTAVVSENRIRNRKLVKQMRNEYEEIISTKLKTRPFWQGMRKVHQRRRKKRLPSFDIIEVRNTRKQSIYNFTLNKSDDTSDEDAECFMEQLPIAYKTLKEVRKNHKNQENNSPIHVTNIKPKSKGKPLKSNCKVVEIEINDSSEDVFVEAPRMRTKRINDTPKRVKDQSSESETTSRHKTLQGIETRKSQIKDCSGSRNSHRKINKSMTNQSLGFEHEFNATKNIESVINENSSSSDEVFKIHEKRSWSCTKRRQRRVIRIFSDSSDAAINLQDQPKEIKKIKRREGKCDFTKSTESKKTLTETSLKKYPKTRKPKNALTETSLKKYHKTTNSEKTFASSSTTGNKFETNANNDTFSEPKSKKPKIVSDVTYSGSMQKFSNGCLIQNIDLLSLSLGIARDK